MNLIDPVLCDNAMTVGAANIYEREVMGEGVEPAGSSDERMESAPALGFLLTEALAGLGENPEIEVIKLRMALLARDAYQLGRDK